MKTKKLLVAYLLSTTITVATATSQNLWLGRGDYWRSSLPITIINPSDQPLEGTPVSLMIGDQPGMAPLANTRSEAIRVVNSEGTQLLYGLWSGNQKLVISGTVPSGSTLVLPAICPPRTSVVYRLYYNNPTAWGVADFFTTQPDNSQNTTSSAKVTALAGEAEHLELSEVGADAPWLPHPDYRPHWTSYLIPSFLRKNHHPAATALWQYRLPLRLLNQTPQATGSILAIVNLNSIIRGSTVSDIYLTFQGERVTFSRLGKKLIFPCDLPPHTIQTYYLYLSTNTKHQPSTAHPATSTLGSDIPSDQVPASGEVHADIQPFMHLLHGSANLVQNPDFTQGTPEQPEYWSHSTPEPGVSYHLADDGCFSNRCASLSVAPGTRPAWRGWRQSVAVKPGHSYIFGAWLASENLQGSATLHAHLRRNDGSITSNGYLGAGPAISGDSPWTPLFNLTTIPPDAAQLQLHLTMNTTGILKHDGAMVAECITAIVGDPQTISIGNAIEAWQVNPIIKVFPETMPPARNTACQVALARNEAESLQLAIRASSDITTLEAEVDPPRGSRNTQLAPPEIGWVDYVPIDHPSSYYSLTTPAWELKFPSNAGSSDGWAGWWPDPISPYTITSLTANRTHSLWLTFKTDPQSQPGNYRGNIRLKSDGKTIKSIPYTLTVWNFTLPERPSCAAIYDIRMNQQWLHHGKSEAEARDEIMQIMADKKVCPDNCGVNLHFKRDSNGTVTCDFTAYDAAMERYFDHYKFPFAYTPRSLYLFGWEHPPRSFLGEAPFEGEPPYTNADRTRLRPEYKAAYQDALRLYWQHMQAKGWANRIVLYISDEPYLDKTHIKDQMKACCTMIHEVDPDIRIYCSTWRHCPDWNGYLNIWGIGHYGCFPAEEMETRRAAGDAIWFTTDGQMCTDTPYCAVERLLPHYCFKYGAEAYEFWGMTWFTYDPWQKGWHRYIHQSSTPGEYYYVRYPNGDGYLIYPGTRGTDTRPVTTIRLEAARDGVEDYEYLKLLQARTHDPAAQHLLAEFAALAEIPNAGGRFSTRILPDPDLLTTLRHRAGTLLSRPAPQP